MENYKGDSKLIYEIESFKLNGIAFRVQKELGRFAREKQYGDLFERILIEQQIPYRREVSVGDTGNRLDFWVYNLILLELKAKPFVLKEDYFQVQRYLHVLNAKLGIIYNFRDGYIKPKRIINSN